MLIYWIKLNRFLGHGRALETFLAGGKISVSVYFFVQPKHVGQVSALYDLMWYVPEIFLIAPLFIIGMLQITGLVLNYYGVEWSWVPRAVGASSATFLWGWVIVKNIEIGAYGLSIPICTWLLLGSSWIWWKAWNRLPVPGAAGLT